MAAQRQRRRGALATTSGRAALGLVIAVASSIALGSPRAETTPKSSEAEAPAEDDDPRIGLGLTLGYGHGIAPRSRQTGRDVADVEILSIEPQWMVRLARLGDGAHWYHGNLDGTLAAWLLINFSPTTGPAGGVDVGLRYRVRRRERLQPFVDAAVGLGGNGFGLQSQADGFTFFLQAGLGVRLRLSSRLGLTTSLRWQHVSNAQIQQPNNGIDTIGFAVGVERW